MPPSRLLLATLLLLAFSLALPAEADDTPHAARQELRKRLTSLLDRQDQLSKAVVQAQEEILKLKTRLQQSRASSLRMAEESERIKTETSQISAQVAGLQGEVERLRRLFNLRLRSLFLHGPEASAYLFAGARDFHDTLRRSQRLTYLARDDKQRLNELTGQQERLGGLRSRLAFRQNELIELGRQQTKEQQNLKDLRGTQEELLAVLKERQNQLAANISALEEALGRLARTFASGQDEQISPAKKPGVVAARGGLSPPVEGRIIGRSGPRRQGVILASRAGSPVRSPWWGKVVFAGPLTGYGNLVVLDHGERVHTVLAHLGSLSVEAGQNVDAGGLVGTMGYSGRLYLEVRRGARPENPLKWLRFSP